MNIPIYVDLDVCETTQQFSLCVEETTEQFGVDIDENDQQFNIESLDRIVMPYKIYYDSMANWNNKRTLVSERATLYIYYDYGQLDDKDVPSAKIGDGTSYLIDLPFIGEQIMRILIDHINNYDVHITADDRAFWNNKSAAFLDAQASETLVLSNNRIDLGGEIITYG